MKTLIDFQKIMGDSNWLYPTIRLTTQELDVFQTLQGDSDYTVQEGEADRVLTLVEQRLQDAYVDCIDPNLTVFWLLCLQLTLLLGSL